MRQVDWSRQQKTALPETDPYRGDDQWGLTT
jgi:hypothetical protein